MLAAVAVPGAVAELDEDVGGLDVPVHQAVLVRGVQRPRDLGQDPQRAVLVDRADAHGPPQVDPLDQQHVEVELAVDLAEVVHRDDVRVAQPGHDPRLPLEPGPVLPVGHRTRQPLQRDDPVAGAVVGAVHDAHAALPQQIPHVVRAEVRRTGPLVPAARVHQATPRPAVRTRPPVPAIACAR